MPANRMALSGAGIVLLAAALFGTLGVFSRAAYAAGLAPFAFVAWRAGVGTLGVSIASAGRGSGAAAWSHLAGATPAALRSLVLAIVLGAALNLAIFLAFDQTTVALALLGFYTYPAMVAGASVALGHERLDLARGLALLLALGGMTAVVLGGTAVGLEAGGEDLAGIVLALAAAAFQAGWVLTSRGYRGIPTDVAMGTILAGSAVLAAAATVVTVGPAALALPLGDPGLLGLLLVVGLFAAALPSTLFLAGIRRIGPLRTGILMLFEPVVGVLLAAAFLDEGLSGLQVAGGATILAAAALAQRGPSGATSEPIAVLPAPGGP